MSSSDPVVLVRRVLRPEVLIPASYETARPDWRRLAVLIAPVPLALAGALGFILAVEPRERPLAVMLTLLLGGLNFVILMVCVMNWRVAWNGLRVGVGVGVGLRVVGSGFTGLPSVFAGICFLAAAGIVVWSQVHPEVTSIPSSSGRGGAGLLLLMGLGCVIGACLKRIFPSGIMIDEEAIWARKGIIERRIEWSDLERASVRVSGKIASLELSCSDGPTISMTAIYIGSNPYFVAELLTYFLTHPEERGLLRDASAAIQAVMEVA